MTDTHYRISEAQRLHRTLISLNLYLGGQTLFPTDSRYVVTAMGLCYAARVTLYKTYAFNEHYQATEARIAEETEMQQASFDGLKEVTQGVNQLAQNIIDASLIDEQLISKSILITHSLYLTALELGVVYQKNKLY